MPIYEIETPDGRLIEIEGPNTPSLEIVKKAYAKLPPIEQTQQQEPEALSYMDRFVSSVKDKSIPALKQDLKNISSVATNPTVLDTLKNLAESLISRQSGNMLSDEPVFDQQLYKKTTDIGQKIIEDPAILPRTAKQVADTIADDFVDSASGVANPEDPYSFIKDLVNLGGSVLGGYQVGKQGTKAALKTAKNIKKGTRKTGEFMGLVKPNQGSINQTEYTSAKDLLNKPNIRELFSGTKKVSIDQFTDSRFINQVGANTGKNLNALKKSIIEKQSNAVPDTIVPSGIHNKILKEFKKNEYLKPLIDIKKTKKLTVGQGGERRGFNLDLQEIKEEIPLTNPKSAKDILRTTTAIKPGVVTSKANLINIIKEILDPKLTAKKAYSLRQQADESINFNDPKKLQRPYQKIREILDDALKNPEFNPMSKQYAKETNNLRKLLYNDKVKSLLKESDPTKTTGSFGEKVMSAKPEAQTAFRDVISKLDLDEDQKYLQKIITEGLDTLEMSKAYKEISAPLLKELPFGIGKFGEQIYKRSLPMLQQGTDPYNKIFITPYVAGKIIPNEDGSVQKSQVEQKLKLQEQIP